MDWTWLLASAQPFTFWLHIASLGGAGALLGAVCHRDTSVDVRIWLALAVAAVLFVAALPAVH